jgi:peptide/nickel transport system substrate-binding protein
MIADPGSINPILASDSYGRSIVGMLYPSLGTITPSGALRPLLAQSWSVRASGLRIDVTIRQGLRWTNGQPVTARDVATTFTAMANARDRSPYLAVFGVMSDVAPAGADRLVIDLSRPDASFLHAMLLVPIAPASVLARLVGRGKALAANAELNTEARITAGPFRLVSWNRESGTLHFVRNSAYPWGRARLAGLTLQYEPTADTAWSAFVDGQVAIANVPSDATAQARALAKAGKARLLSEPSSTYAYIPFNMADPIWDDPRVRQAAIEAVDRPAIAAQLQISPGTPTGGPPPLSAVASRGAMAGMGYNLAKARSLLERAGWTVGEGGVRYRHGHPLAFTLVTVAGVPLWDRYVGIAAYDLHLAGFDVTVAYQTFASLSQSLARPDRSANPGAWALAWTMTPTSDARALFGGRDAFAPAGQDVGGYADPAVTSALQTLAVGAPAAAMKSARASLRAALRTDPPAIFLFKGTATVAVAPGLHIPVARVTTGQSVAWPEDWYYTRP